MSDERRFPTRQAVIIYHTQMMLAQTSCKQIDFAKLLTLNYLAMVPAHARDVSLRDWKGREEDERDHIIHANVKAVQRYLSGEVRIPIELEEAWVASLGEGYQEQCVFDLMFRYGLIPVPILENVDLDNLSTMMNEHADALRALAPMFADGKICEADAPFAAEAHQQLIESVAFTGAVAHAIKTRFPALVHAGKAPKVTANAKSKPVPLQSMMKR